MNFKKVLVLFVLLVVVVALVEFGIDVGTKYRKAKSANDIAKSGQSTDKHNPEKKPLYRFLVIGDNGSGLPAQRAVAEAMELRCFNVGGYDGMFFLGDLIYPDGVQSLDDPQWQTLYEDYYRKSQCLSKLMAYAVLGNHDYHGKPSAWIERHQTSPLFFFPSRSWAVDFGDVVTVVGVDSEVPWLEGSAGLEKLGDQTAWRFALGHHPFLSATTGGGRHKHAGFVGNALQKQLCGKIHVYMSGHAHHLEHRPMLECNYEHLISGAGGGGLQPAEIDDPSAHFVANRFGFFEVSVTAEKLEVRAFDSNGDRLYGFQKLISAAKL